METDQKLINKFFLNHSDTAIQCIDEFEIAEIAELMDNLTTDQCITILSRLPIYKSGKIIEIIRLERVCELVEVLNPRLAQAILRVTNETIREQILKGISKKRSLFLSRTLKYPTNRVGSHIEPFVLTLPHSIEIKKALAIINSNQAVVKPHIFVLDEEAKLIGYIELNDLIIADPTAHIQSITKEVTKPAFVDMHVNDLLEHWNYAFIDLPVVNIHGIFLGTVSRILLGEYEEGKSKIDNSAIKAGNALGELYLIGLTSLLGNASNTDPKN